MSPFSTARIAACASGSVFTNHWSVSQGSMTACERSPRGTVMRCVSVRTSRPRAARSSTIFARAAKRSSPS